MKQNAIMDRTWLEKARREKGHTQIEVAQAANVTAAFYNRVEKGLYTPNVVTGVLITDFLGLDVHAFINEKPIM